MQVNPNLDCSKAKDEQLNGGLASQSGLAIYVAVSEASNYLTDCMHIISVDKKEDDQLDNRTLFRTNSTSINYLQVKMV
jgi:hypothetical protein